MILAGDVGGTKTLLAAYEGARCVARERFNSHAFASFAGLLADFIGRCGGSGSPAITGACFGIAGPVSEGRVRVTNLPWEIDGAALARRFGIPTVTLLNDFEAAAYGLAALGPDDLVTLQRGEPQPQRPRVLIGAGTGLGAAYVVEGRVIAGESGHLTFAPVDDEQARLADWLRARVGRVEVEHVVCGAGQTRICEFLLATRSDLATEASARRARQALAAADPARAITRHALDDGDPLALAAVDLFIRCYGALAGDHALAVTARGGVYVAGGIAPKLLPRLAGGGFLAAFNDKGRFAVVTRACPVHVVTNTELGLLGAARVAAGAATADGCPIQTPCGR